MSGWVSFVISSSEMLTPHWLISSHVTGIINAVLQMAISDDRGGNLTTTTKMSPMSMVKIMLPTACCLQLVRRDAA